MIRPLLLLFLAGLAMPSASCSGEAAPPPATIEDFMEAVRASDDVRHGFFLSLETMMEAMGEELSEGQRAELEAAMDWEGLDELLKEVFLRHMSQRDIDELTAFYRTPEGQAALDLEAAMFEDAYRVGAEWGEAQGEVLAPILFPGLAEDLEIPVLEAAPPPPPPPVEEY